MSLRTDKVASLIKEEVGMFLTREYRDPGYGFITVTDVHITPDLRIAKIYVSIMGSSEVKVMTLQMLENHKGEIRSFIGSHLRLKFTPSIQFYVDETLDRVDRIDQLIKQIHKDDDIKPR
ncbi:MAG: 30S ribosome-binding factor RbfA [Ignavibacteriales bacterium]|nr:30S ribosome-binding factor RbfA [Ignavibacteriales bacterium]